MPLSVRLGADCYRPGEAASAFARTSPGAGMAFAVAYPDNSMPDYTYVPRELNDDGAHEWRWAIRPDVPPGNAWVNVTVFKDREGATYDAPFRIAAAC